MMEFKEPLTREEREKADKIKLRKLAMKITKIPKTFKIPPEYLVD